MPKFRNSSHLLTQRSGCQTILSKEGKLKREVSEILDLLSRHDVIFSTGHLSLQEIMALVEEAKRRKVRKILVTHPDHLLLAIPVEVQKKLAREGVYFDRCFPTEETCVLTMEKMGAIIREVGVFSTVLSTDFGQPHNPYPVEGMKAYIRKLMRQGFTARKIDRMVKVNPAGLLNIG